MIARVLTIAAVATLILCRSAIAQQAQTPRVRVQPTDRIRLDGLLDEPAWITADSIGQLTEVEPNQGGVPGARTVVRLLAERGVLVVRVRAYDDDPAGWASFSWSIITTCAKTLATGGHASRTS
jgi:hypothetical protein